MILTRFVTVEDIELIFPDVSVLDRLGEAQSSFDFVMTPAGGVDPFGDSEVEDRPHRLYRTCEFVDLTPTELQAHLDAGRRVRGARGTLYADMGDGTTRQLIRVRCIQVEHDRGMRNYRHQTLTWVFDVSRARWRGERHEAWLLDDGSLLDDQLFLDDSGFVVTLDASPKNLSVTNGGNAKVYDALITVTAGSSSLTGLTIRNTTNDLVELTWTGTLATGNALIINCGSFSVTNNGVDAYDELVLDNDHQIGEWMQIDPGSSILEFTKTGGSTNSTVRVEFADRWK